MTTTKRDLTFLAAIFLGMAMAEPTLEKHQDIPELGEKGTLAFYEIFGNDNQEGVSDEQRSDD